MNAKFRITCPQCGEVGDFQGPDGICPKCKNAVKASDEACVYLYRQGSPLGVGDKFGIYINGTPTGFIGNKETVCFPLPYGTYTFHAARGMNRKCKDMTITLSPENRTVYIKVYMRMGFWTNSFVFEPWDPNLLDK